jgi:hypothetical protein
MHHQADLPFEESASLAVPITGRQLVSIHAMNSSTLIACRLPPRWAACGTMIAPGKAMPRSRSQANGLPGSRVTAA